MRRWNRNAIIRYFTPTPKILLMGGVTFLTGVIIKLVEWLINNVIIFLNIENKIDLSFYYYIVFCIALVIMVVAIIEKLTRKDARNIKYIIRKRLCAYKNGNPLDLKNGEIEPYIYVVNKKNGFKIRIECQSTKFENLSKLETVISDALRKKYRNYAVVNKEEDIAGNYVDYIIKNVVSEYSKQDIYISLDDVPSCEKTKLYINDEISIDYSKVLNGSALIVGGTRSGKTTGIISVFLLPILKQGTDDFNSKVIIVDPKSAELSQCKHVLAPDINGNVMHILEAVRDFNKTRIDRQHIINDEGKKRGKAVKWFDIGMKPCILFIDEWVSLQDLFPKKSTKENPRYSLSDFQGLIRQIATQGASAGCFLIISTAQASVGVGGLESVVNNACGIRVMFKPNKTDASFIWNTKQLEVLREWSFNPGDAWFSIDDGINNNVNFVKFPMIDEKFDEYHTLSDLMEKYYTD